MEKRRRIIIELDQEPNGGTRCCVMARPETAGIAMTGTIRFERGCDYTQHADTRPSRLIIESGTTLIEDLASFFGMAITDAPGHIPLEQTLKNIEGLLRDAFPKRAYRGPTASETVEVRGPPDVVHARAMAGKCYGCGLENAAPLCPTCKER